jgi:hypothetical protein
LNVRDSEFDRNVREFEVTTQGLQVHGPVRSAEGLLTGKPRALALPATLSDS